MDAEMAAGFAAVIASLLAIALLVFFSRRSIDQIHRQGLAGRQGPAPGREPEGDRGHPL